MSAGILHRIVHDQVIGPAGHVGAAGAIGASVVGMLTPGLTALSLVLACAWYAVALWEMPTVQKLVAWVKSKF